MKNRGNKQISNNKIIGINPNMSIIILLMVNGLSTVKKQRLSEWIKIISKHMLSTRNLFPLEW